MNDQLKQRLVGAVVLVSLAVIFIPMILPGGGDSGSLTSKKVPPEPDYRFPPPKDVPKAPAIGNEPIVPIGDSKNANDKTADESKSDENKSTAAADKAQVDKPVASTEETKNEVGSSKQRPPASADLKPGRTTAWIVQVGSFSSEHNARALRDRLRKMGYACFVEALKNNNRMVYRVRVGPELTKASAQKLQDQLARKAKVKGIVQAYP